MRGGKLAEFLMDGDDGDVNKTMEELKAYDTNGIKLCRTLAIKYSKQLWQIYLNKEDPYSRHNDKFLLVAPSCQDMLIKICKNVSLSSRLNGWDWRRHPVTVTEQQQHQSCSEIVSAVVVGHGCDSWEWTDAADKTFSVVVCRILLNRNAVPFYPFEWVKGVQRKVCIFGCTAIQDRLPTMVGLKKRNILHGSPLCKLCGDMNEDADHLFTSCIVASNVWQKISSWVGIPPIFVFTVKDLLELHKRINANMAKRNLVRILVLTTCWMIWKARNEAIFSGKRANAAGVFGEVQATAFTWVKFKDKQSGWTWENWVAFNSPVT